MTANAGPRFTGFPRATFDWFAGLEEDNTREFFTAHRETYDGVVRGALETMLEQLADELGGHVKLFRQHRDVRFSHDKSPYKLTTYGLIAERPGSYAALYAQLSSAGLFAGSGYYQLAADQLQRFRDGVDDDTSGPDLEAAVATAESAGAEIFGVALKTAPRGYNREHPRIALLRHKSLFGGRRLAAGPKGLTAAHALTHTRRTWAACTAINMWLDAHVGASQIPADSRPRGGRPR